MRIKLRIDGPGLAARSNVFLVQGMLYCVHTVYTRQTSVAEFPLDVTFIACLFLCILQ